MKYGSSEWFVCSRSHGQPFGERSFETIFTNSYNYDNFNGNIDDFRVYTGSLSADEVKSLYSGSEGIKIKTGDDTNHGFSEGDIIRAQKFTGNNIMQSNMVVTNVSSSTTFFVEPHNTTLPEIGYEYVRLGNVFDTDRQGSIYMTADDDNAPFIDVVDDITAHSDFNTAGKIKTRIGKLDGVSTSTFTISAGTYGFYASGSAYLEGTINATSGSIGDFIIDNTEIRDTGNSLRL